MGRKITNPKLLKKQEGTGSMASAFQAYASKLAQAKRRKIQKVGDTKQRLMEAKRTNKMLKVSKRTSKFALLEDQPAQGLTHRGQKITDLQEFNDINFGSDQDDEQFQQAHDQLNFTGFDEPEQEGVPDRPKSKTEVYKEIIEKSKMHKHLRQELYEENLEKATELDQAFPALASHLQFRTRDSNVKSRLSSNDHDFEKLANELKDDQKVVSNKVLQKNEKYTDKVRQKKTAQLNALLKDSSDEEGDIRRWVKGKQQHIQQEDQEDEIDDVQLSSGDEDEDEEGEEEGEEQNEDDEDEEEEGEEEEEESLQAESQGQENNDESQEEVNQVAEQSSSSQPPAKKKQIIKQAQKQSKTVPPSNRQSIKPLRGGKPNRK